MHRRQLLSLLACAPLLAGAQEFPERPVRLILPFSAGSGPDVVVRIVAEQLSAQWKQPVVVDNRPGANGFIGMAAGKAAAPTGYDLVAADVGNLATNASLFKQLPYNPKTDFAPVTLLYRTAFFVAVGADNRIKSFAGLVQAARSEPGRVSYASSGVGSPLHLGGAMVASATGTNLVHVPFRDGRQLYTAVASGEVDFVMATVASAGPLLQGGRLRLLAIADDRRSTLKPEVPTVLEAGGPDGIHVSSWLALVAPRGTPPAITEKVRLSVATALKHPEVVQKLASMGFTPAPGTSAELAQLIARDTEFYGDLVRRTGASAD